MKSSGQKMKLYYLNKSSDRKAGKATKHTRTSDDGAPSGYYQPREK